MADKIQLPNGALFPVKEGESKEQALAVAQKMYPDAFAQPEEAPKKSGSGLGDLARSFSSSALGATGALASVFGADNAASRSLSEAGESLQKGLSTQRQAQLQKQAERMQQAEASGSTLQELKAGALNVLEAPLISAAQFAGSIVPVLLTLPLAKLGLGARAVMAARGAISGAQGAGAVKQNIYEAVLRAETEEGKSPEQAQAAAARAQNYVGENLDQILLGGGLGVGTGLIGVEKLLPGGVRAQAGAAQQALAKRVGERAATGVTTALAEMPIEGTQGAQERVAANLALQRTGRDVDTFTGAAGQFAQEALTGGLGGGALGAALPDRSVSMAAAQERKAKQVAAAATAEQERIAQEQEDAKKQTPEYALQVANQLKTLEQEKLDLQKQIRSISKDSLTEAEDKAHNKEIQAKLSKNAAARDALAPEKNRLVQSGIYDQALEQQRVAGLSPMDYLLERTKTVQDRAVTPVEDTAYEESGLAFSDPLVPSVERRKAQEAERARVANIPMSYAAERMELARTQTYDPTGQDFVEYLLQDPYKAGLLIETRTPLPGLSSSESTLIRNAVAKRLKDMGKEELAARQAELKEQKIGKAPADPMAAFMEQSDTLDTDRRQGVTDADLAFIERKAAMPTKTVTQGELFGGAEQRVNMPQAGTPADIDAQIAELERQLDVAKSYGAPDSATRPGDREGRRANRERVSTLMEQITDLKDRQAKIASGTPMGVKSDAALSAYIAAGTPDRKPDESIEDWYARTEKVTPTTSGLPEQEKTVQARRDALSTFTGNDYMLRNGLGDIKAPDVETAKQSVVDAMLKEIGDVRGKLKPETITAIETQVRQLLDNKMMFGQDYNQALDTISNRWRAGIQRGKYGATQPTPTQTSTDMLRTQMDRAFAQRQRYDAQTLSILDQIAENFKAFNASPERRNMAGEWLNRVTQTGRSSPEMTRDVQNELAQLERAKISETEKGRTAVQQELDADFMPEAVAPQSETRIVNGKVQYVSPEDKGPLQGSAAERYAPMQKGTIFATQKELDEYLSSDYLKEARENQGLARETVSRLSKQVAKYEANIADTQKQIDALQERKTELQTVQVSERRAADNIVADTEVQLEELLKQLADDLGPIRMALEQAEMNLAAAEARSEETSRLIANNIANFTAMDDKVVRAAQDTAAAKADLRKARNKLGSLEEKRPGIEEAQRKVIAALQRQRNPVLYEMQEKLQELQVKLSKARVVQPQTVERLKKEIAELEDQMDVQRDNPYVPSSAMITFLNNDLQLQMDAMQDRATIGAAKRSVLYFKKKLDKAASDLKVDISTHPEVKALREQISTGKELGTDALRGVEGEMALLDSEIEKAQLSQQAIRRQTENIEDQIIKAGEERTFAGQLAGITPDTVSALDRAETLAKDKKKLEEFQGRTQRLAALPGQRIDFSKRQEMFQMVKAATEDFAQLDADIEALREGVEELQVRDHFMHEEMLDLQDQAKSFRGPRKNSNAGKEHFAKMEAHKKKMEENTKRIQSLRDSITQYEKTRVTKQAALAKAETAMSSDPEVYQTITKSIDARMAKLDKTIAGKQSAVVKGDAAILEMARDIKAKADEGKTAPEALAKMRERLKVLKASQADRNKHLKEYIKERDVLKARRSNRLGITRTLANMDALKEDLATAEARLRTVTSTINSKSATKQEKAVARVEAATLTEAVEDLRKRTATKPKKATITEQEQRDAELDRVQELARAKERKAELDNGLAALQKAKEPKTEDKKIERADRIAALQADINKQQALIDSLTPQTMGAVSQATRVQSAAPGKLRAGTAESKADAGVTKQPIVEKRTVAQPTAEQAVADANAFAERLNAAKTEAQRTKLMLEQDETTRFQLEDALLDRVQDLKNRVLRLEEERRTLTGAKGMTAITRLNAVNRELTGEKQEAGDIETNGLYYYLRTAEKELADFEASLAKAEAAEMAKAEAKEDAERAEYGAFITELGEVKGGTGVSGFDMGMPDDGFNDYEFSRGAPADGGQTVASLEKALDKVVGNPGVAGKRIKIFQSVSDLFNDPAYKYDYDGADIPADAKAFVNPKNGQAFMFADNIGKGEALGVLLHEIGVHVGFRNLFNKAQYGRLVAAVKGWANRNDNSLESRVAKRAVARVEAAETTAEQYDDELLAYTVEEAIKAGVNPDALQGGSPIRNWLKSVMDVLRNALSKYGINTKTLTTGDLVNMAYGAAQLELRGTWHGTDAAFTAFDTKYAGAGEGAFDLRFEADKSLGAGPYTTPNKEYAEYYQNAVPFGKAANESGYGAKTYQDYRAMDEKFMTTPNENLSVGMLQSQYESNLLTNYLNNVSAGGTLDPVKNAGVKKYIADIQAYANTRLQDAEKTLAGRIKRKSSADSLKRAEADVAYAQRFLKAVAKLDASKINGLTQRPNKGNLYRTLDDIPRSRIYEINSTLTYGERPAIDALFKKYASERDKQNAAKEGVYNGNAWFFDMREKVGIKKATELLKTAGIDAIEQNNERGKYVERAYIDQAPEILGINLQPVGPATGKGRPGTGTLLFSRGAPANALEALALDITTQPKTLREKLGNNLALQAEMNAVDMRAGLRETLKFGDDRLFMEAMYRVRKAEQKMAQMFTVMNSGPLVQYTDSKGFIGYRSSNKNSAIDVFDAIADIPVDDPQMKTNIAQAYMVAQRAANKGLSKLDLGELGITEEKLKAALAAANADPALKTALENVRRKYNAYNKGMIEFLAESGRISKKAAADLLKDGDYVPYYRVKDGNATLHFGNNVTFNVGDIRRQPYLAELKGGETKLLPLNEAIQQNTLLLTDMALTNNATKSVAYGLQALGKGMGPINPDTGKPTNLMAIKPGFGPDDAKVIRFYQEPDPNKPDDDGKRHLVINTKGTLAEGIPAEMVVKSLEGASLALPGFFKLGGAAADLLRAGVTRTPLYIARKLIREPMAAAFTGGLNQNTFSAIFSAGAEFVRMSRGTSDAQAKLIEKGLIQSNIFAGDMSDMKKMALQLASGKDQSAFDKVLAAADRYAMRADAATLALVLKNAQENGLSEVEADMMTMESMNFYKRGLSPTLQYAARLIPFFNAQIQGLNVLVKAARGNMPFEEQQQIKRKFFNNALLLMGTGLVYAMAMEDDETFRNARPRDKYSNFFLPIPGVEEPLKMPIPFEAGYFFSLAVAAVDGMRAETDGKAQFQALRDLFLGSIPGYSSMGIPQIVKPAFEVWADKNFLTGGPIEPRRMQNFDVEERYLATTTELAKQMSKALPILSPIQIEHIVRGYLGVLPLAAAAGANGLFESADKGEKPAGRASDLPLIGTAFQKKYGGGDADVVYREAQDSMQARDTLNKMIKEGRREEALAYRDKNRAELAMASAAGQYRQVVGRINADIRRTQERNDLTAEEKRLRLDMLDKAKQDRADAFIRQTRLVEERVGAGRT